MTAPTKEPPPCSNCQRPLVEVYARADPNYATFNPETGKYEWNTNPEQASFYCEECNKPLGEEETIVWGKFSLRIEHSRPEKPSH